jgi:hypothetical protein
VATVLSLGAFAAPALAQSSVDVTVAPTFSNTATTTFQVLIRTVGNATDTPIGSVTIDGAGDGDGYWNSAAVTGATGGATGTATVNSGQLSFSGSVAEGQTVTITASHTVNFPGCDLQLGFNTSAQDTGMNWASVANGGPSYDDYSGCELQFATQPQNSVPGKPMSPVVVNALSPCSDPCGTDYSGPVTLSLAPNSAGATLTGTTTVNASDGEAVFNNISVSRPANGLVLIATAGDMIGYDNEGYERSAQFNAHNAQVTCTQGNSGVNQCNTTVSSQNGRSSFAVTAFGDPNHPNTSTLIEDVWTTAPIPGACAGMGEPDPSSYVFTMQGAGPQYWSGRGVYLLKPQSLLGGTLQALLGSSKLCYGGGYDFITSAGQEAPPATLPNGNAGFAGLLPNCGTTGATVCVQSRQSRLDLSSPIGFDLLVTVFVPEGLMQDPADDGWARCC